MLEKIERVRQHRRHKFYLRDERITLSHGSGGKATHNLIEGVFAPAFDNPLLDRMDDSAILDMETQSSKIRNLTSKIAFTTDTYVVSPLFFPGGDIGKPARSHCISRPASSSKRASRSPSSGGSSIPWPRRRPRQA